MEDRDVVAEIDRLADEEHRLERAHVGQPLSEAEVVRLRELEVALDRCWDLLRQRRARRQAGLDPEDVKLRSEATVEGYQQ